MQWQCLQSLKADTLSEYGSSVRSMPSDNNFSSIKVSRLVIFSIWTFFEGLRTSGLDVCRTSWLDFSVKKSLLALKVSLLFSNGDGKGFGGTGGFMRGGLGERSFKGSCATSPGTSSSSLESTGVSGFSGLLWLGLSSVLLETNCVVSLSSSELYGCFLLGSCCIWSSSTER